MKGGIEKAAVESGCIVGERNKILNRTFSQLSVKKFKTVKKASSTLMVSVFAQKYGSKVYTDSSV